MTDAFAQNLLAALERTGPRPALAWYGEASRIELSGHVLANWVIKSVGHLHDEIALTPGAAVVMDVPPHWKRLVLALAVWSLGGGITAAEETRSTAFIPHRDQAMPDLLITDRPDDGPVENADEVLAVDAVSLAPRFSGALPPLVHDWAQEVRASPDHLSVPLPHWSGPAPAAGGAAAHRPNAVDRADDAPVRLLVEQDGLEELPHVLAALLSGGGIVGPAGSMSARQVADEQVTARP